MAEYNELATYPPGSPEGGTNVRASLEQVIAKLMAQEPAKVPTLSPEETLRKRQLGTLGVLSGDRPSGLVGGQLLSDVEKDEARRELVASREAGTTASRLQGALGLLSARDIASEREQSRRDIANLAQAGKQPPAMTVIEDEQGNRFWADSHTGNIIKPVTVGGEPLGPKTTKLPATEVEKLATKQGLAETFQGLSASFDPKYASTTGLPYLGKAENFFGKIGSTEAANWFKNYNEQKNIVRKELFGTALTKVERSAFEAAIIDEDTPATEIPRRLAQQARASAMAYNKILNAQKGAGYRTDMTPLEVPEAPLPGGPTPSVRGGLLAPGTLNSAQQSRLEELRRRK